MQTVDMRRRIRELLSIPERDRTDAEWEELNELEIRTAPGNRDYDRTQDRQADRRPVSPVVGQGRRPERNNKPPGNKNVNPLRPKTDAPPDGRLLKRQHRRPKRPGEDPHGVAGAPNVMSTSPIIVEIPSSGDKSEE
ncbi:MAG: hypothetical protein LBU43_05555 [Candidatus Accumulibacter sp.]|jgi:hypothetical protein|nr:hypothetical protein [Accumulibacter sp.]